MILYHVGKRANHRKRVAKVPKIEKLTTTHKEDTMTLRNALKRSGWEAFENLQNEEWDTTDLLNSIEAGESPEWLDAECTVTRNVIVDASGDELSRAK
jgi:hypothetical protein